MGRGAELAARARAVHAERAMVLGRVGESCRAGQRGMGRVREEGRKAGPPVVAQGREEEGGKGSANSCAGLKREEKKFFK